MKMPEDEEIGGYYVPPEAIQAAYNNVLNWRYPDWLEELLNKQPVSKPYWRKPELIKVDRIWVNPPEDV